MRKNILEEPGANSDQLFELAINLANARTFAGKSNGADDWDWREGNWWDLEDEDPYYNWEPKPKAKAQGTYGKYAQQIASGGRVGLKPGGLVEPGVTHYAKEDFIRNPAGINQHTAKMKSLDQIKATIDKFPEWTAKDFLGEGTFNKKGIVLSRTELERAKEAGIEPHVKGKRTIKGTGARNLKRRIITKARSSESMEVALAALRKSGLQFSHLALDELTSLQNTGYLPKDINIKGYHKFEKKVVDIAKQIKEAQDNKKLSIPERRNKIAELQKKDRTLRKQFPEYAKTKARLVTKATSLDPSGIMIKEKLPDTKIAISQEPGTQLKGLTPKSEKGQEIIKLAKTTWKPIAKKATKSAAAKFLYPAMVANQMLFGDRFSKGPWDFPLTPGEDAKQNVELLKMIGNKLNMAGGGIASLKRWRKG